MAEKQPLSTDSYTTKYTIASAVGSDGYIVVCTGEPSPKCVTYSQVLYNRWRKENRGTVWVVGDADCPSIDCDVTYQSLLPAWFRIEYAWVKDLLTTWHWRTFGTGIDGAYSRASALLKCAETTVSRGRKNTSIFSGV